MLQANFVPEITRDGIVSRLEPLVVDARSILDLGSATGATGRVLRKRFRGAHVVALDLDHVMLVQARKKRPFLGRASFVRADAERLPFADGQFDVVVANQLLPWISEPAVLFGEIARVLRKGGLFTFATLGPGSPAFARMADMHIVGDGLVRAGLRDPVLDVDRLTVRYEDAEKLGDDLARLVPGAAPVNATATRGKSLELELVYGHCWGAGPANDPAVTRIDANRIPLRR